MHRFKLAAVGMLAAAGVSSAQGEKEERIIIQTTPGAAPGQVIVQERRAGPGGFGFGGRNFRMAMPEVGKMVLADLEMKEVQTELNLTADERANIPLLKDEIAEGDKKFQEDNKEVDPQAWGPKMNERRAEVDKQIKEVLGDKYARFRQIRLQLDGLWGALMSRDKEVQDAIGFGDDQRAKLMEAIQANRSKDGESSRQAFRFNPGDGPPSEEKMKEMMEEGKKRMEEMTTRMTDEADKALTPEQKKKWEELIGPKIAFKRPAPPFGGGMRFGGPGGRRRGGGEGGAPGGLVVPPTGDAPAAIPVEGIKTTPTPKKDGDGNQ